MSLEQVVNLPGVRILEGFIYNKQELENILRTNIPLTLESIQEKKYYKAAREQLVDYLSENISNLEYLKDFDENDIIYFLNPLDKEDALIVSILENIGCKITDDITEATTIVFCDVFKEMVASIINVRKNKTDADIFFHKNRLLKTNSRNPVLSYQKCAKHYDNIYNQDSYNFGYTVYNPKALILRPDIFFSSVSILINNSVATRIDLESSVTGVGDISLYFRKYPTVQKMKSSVIERYINSTYYSSNDEYFLSAGISSNLKSKHFYTKYYGFNKRTFDFLKFLEYVRINKKSVKVILNSDIYLKNNNLNLEKESFENIFKMIDTKNIGEIDFAKALLFNSIKLQNNILSALEFTRRLYIDQKSYTRKTSNILNCFIGYLFKYLNINVESYLRFSGTIFTSYFLINSDYYDVKNILKHYKIHTDFENEIFLKRIIPKILGADVPEINGLKQTYFSLEKNPEFYDSFYNDKNLAKETEKYLYTFGTRKSLNNLTHDN